MSVIQPDQMVLNEVWSDLAAQREMPLIDHARLYAYRQQRLREQMQAQDVAMCILVSPVSLRYAIEYRNYALFQSHIPSTYLFMPQGEGPLVLHGAYDPYFQDEIRPARPLAVFDGGSELQAGAELLAEDVLNYLAELGTDNRRVAVEYVNPSLTQALMRRGLEVVDGVTISEQARVIKSADEVNCIRWAIAVAELGIAKMQEAIRPGVSELQLWALLNYTNVANNGDWHDGRMLASGPRINPWLQEASPRKLEAGDLVGLDTDMVGPFGYFADISRTFYCGPGQPSKRQKQLYRYAMEEIDYNLKLVRPGVTLHEFQEQAWPVPEAFRQNAYSCVMHGVGMCDEFPQVKPLHRGITPYPGTLEAGMVLCVESYIGAVGERDGVKLEQQILVTGDGYELLSQYPLDEKLLD